MKIAWTVYKGGTLLQRSFISVALDVIDPDWSCSRTKGSLLMDFDPTWEPEHFAHHAAILGIKVIIADGAPHPLVHHLNPARGQVVPACQPDLNVFLTVHTVLVTAVRAVILGVTQKLQVDALARLALPLLVRAGLLSLATYHASVLLG